MYIAKDDEGKVIDLVDPNKEGESIGFMPVLRGEMITKIARPGHGKTATSMRWARQRAADIRARCAAGDPDAMRRVVVYVTLEQPVEELNAFHIAASMSETNRMNVTAMAMGKISDTQMSEISRINTNSVADPLWIIGHSLESKRKKPLITVPMIEDAVYGIKDWETEDDFIIDSLFIDYLQKIPYIGRDKVIGISNNLGAIKNVISNVVTSGVVDVQSSREVDERSDPTPTMSDGQWTSSIEQDSDGVIAIMRPCRYFSQGETVGSRGIVVKGTNQMKMAFLKRKLGPAPFERWINFDVAYNKIIEAEMKYIDLRDYTERE